jgi:hypothetical protein
MKPGSRDIKTNILISGDELTELKRHAWLMVEAFGLDSNSKSINDVRNKLSGYIKRWHKSDDRVILSLRFDGKKINAEWIELEKYLDSK